MKLLRKAHGFTLLELLIVIAIIGILVSLGVAAYSQAQKKARDSRRMGDMKSFQNAMEQYYADNNGVYAKQTSDLGTSYLPAGMPTDPKPNQNYTITLDAVNGASYCACGLLEGTAVGGNSTVNNCSNFAAGQYYCVKNLQ